MNDELRTILDPSTIRVRTACVFEEAVRGGTAFSVHLEHLPACIDAVMDVTKRTYPDGNIPLHGRYEHFRVGGVDRVARLVAKLPGDKLERARSLIDLVVVSVLLDAGAGSEWAYTEAGVKYPRSEGLAVASLAMFEAGALSDDPSRPYQVTAARLEKLTLSELAQGFQVSKDNPLLAVEGRLGLLTRLAASMYAFPDHFPGENPRPGNLLDVLLGQGPVRAQDILRHLLLGFSRMWPPRVTIGGVGFGDVWPRNGSGFDSLIPFHKLSQWLTYSLIEPIESAGVRVEGVDELTGLPEYRNGGLFLDHGVLKLRDPSLAKLELEAGSPQIIEWRALTVQLLDRVGEEVRKRLGKTSQELPLARVLQGGTWSAGREIARKLRPGGPPPLTLKSDGMVF